MIDSVFAEIDFVDRGINSGIYGIEFVVAIIDFADDIGEFVFERDVRNGNLNDVIDDALDFFSDLEDLFADRSD